MRIRALILRITQQFIHDKRTMALLIVAPLLVLTLMYLVFNGDSYKPALGAVNLPSAFASALENHDAEITSFPSQEEAAASLEKQEIDGIISIKEGKPDIRLEGSDPKKSQAIMMLIRTVQQELLSSSAFAPNAAASDSSDATASSADGLTPTASPEISYLHGGEEMTSFDSFGPVLIGVFAFFFVFLIAGVSFLKERTSGTLERLLATPLKRWEIVAGYIAGFGIFTGIQAVLIAIYSIHVLGLMMNGSIWLVLLITLLLSITALSFGTFLSAFANTEFQMIQFIPIVIVPQVFFSGLFDLDNMSPWLRWLSTIMPLKYGADALRSVMIRGQGWQDIDLDLYILIGLSLLFMAANVLALRKHRRI
ncbi:ABC transporter permease [Paenibacillus sp. HB172176]|uniref:ABC transporter permease n=1 Tax=Paenibacillus sp. HB172176 TaxID=2493690 RepID=UPI0014388BB1|nr:ABC transporter permease [Paenibacillus sp. HB172176]